MVRRGVESVTFKKVKLSITDSCEGKCSFCYRGPIRGRTNLPIGLVASVFEESTSCGVKQFHISGGNPTLHPDFQAIMEKALSYDVPIKLSTNMTRITHSHLQEYAEEGLEDLGLSIDSTDSIKNDAIRGIPGDLHRVMACLHYFAGSSLRLTVTFVLTSESVHEIARFRRILRIGSNIVVKMQFVERSLLPSTDSELPHLSAKEIAACCSEIGDLQSEFGSRVKCLPPNDTCIDGRLPYERWSRGLFGPQVGENAHCSYMLFNPHIKEDGSVYPCCGKAEDRILGNVGEESLVSIYNRHLHAKAAHATAPYSSCRSCVFYSHYREKERPSMSR